jgi:U4/U6.U5 tri-snRNP-associated protein 2
MTKRKTEEEDEFETKKQKMECPYLDTINRKKLDFDLEKQCSETLANFNIYCCLVCGKYFQGRGNKTPAYFHSLQEEHHVFLNVNSSKVYCIPDDYEVNDPSLKDIIVNLSPKYTEKEINEIDSLQGSFMSLQSQKFIPGFIGLNNLKNTGGFNVIIQSLTKIVPLRNFLLSYPSKIETPILNSFSELTRKLWNSKNFKNHVSPQEFLQEIRKYKKLEIGKVVDPFQFLVWFLNTTHSELSKSKLLTKRSMITDIFKGEIKMTTQIIPVKEEPGAKISPPITKKMPFL